MYKLHVLLHLRLYCDLPCPLQRQRASIPCYWESQPSGCLKQHCPFKHTKPRPQVPTVREKISQYKFDSIQVKSLSELRQTSKNAPANKSTKGTVQRSNLNSEQNDVETDGSQFKLENVLEEASQQARGVRKNSVEENSTLNSQRTLLSRSATLKTSEEILGGRKVRKGIPVSRVSSQDGDSTSKLFTPDRISSSESIFSPKFNPILSSLAAQKGSVENGGNVFKLPFNEEESKPTLSSTDEVSSVQLPPSKRSREVETYRPPARKPGGVRNAKSQPQRQPQISVTGAKSRPAARSSALKTHRPPARKRTAEKNEKVQSGSQPPAPSTGSRPQPQVAIAAHPQASKGKPIRLKRRPTAENTVDRPNPKKVCGFTC